MVTMVFTNVTLILVMDILLIGKGQSKVVMNERESTSGQTNLNQYLKVFFEPPHSVHSPSFAQKALFTDPSPLPFFFRHAERLLFLPPSNSLPSFQPLNPAALLMASSNILVFY